MKGHMKDRPKRTALPKGEQEEILRNLIQYTENNLLPNSKINKIVLFGSLAEGTFGEYEKEWKHGLYSDIDIALFVEDGFEIQKTWHEHFKCKMYTVYNILKLDGKHLIQYLVARKSAYTNPKFQKEAEKWGVPLLLEKSRHKHMVLYDRGGE